MNEEQFQDWRLQFDEALIAEYGIDINDTGMSDDDLKRWADEAPSVAATRYAEGCALTLRSAFNWGRK